MKKQIVILLILGFLTMSCAMMFKGTNSKLDIGSEPSGAKIYINGALYGETPTRVFLESKGTYSIEFRKEGYETKVFNLTNHVGAGWLVLDILTGLVPVIIDAATGAWYELDQKYINVLLEKYLIPAY